MTDGSDKLTSWFETAKGEVPLPLTGPSLTLCPLPAPHPATIFLYGGKLVSARRLSEEMWAMDVATRTWSRVNAGPGPGPRYFHSMDVWEDKLVFFGGMSEVDSPRVHNEIWLFDCRTRRWLPQPSPDSDLGHGPSQDASLIPQPRYAHLSAVSRDKLVVAGGQRGDNSWIYEINMFDLRRRVWTSKTDQPESHGMRSKGAYRSVIASSNSRVVVPSHLHTLTGAQALPYSLDEEGQGGDIWCYSNYDFAKVRRELEVLSPLDGDEVPDCTSDRFVSPPDYDMEDLSGRMHGSSQPPGLRFPTGGIVGNHFILCGLYLASTTAAFSIWALDLSTFAWRHLEPPVLQTGSWNRIVLCPNTARLMIFGNATSDLTVDYGKRSVNLDHFAIIELESYGIYRPPKLLLSEQTQDVGLNMINEQLISDFDIVCEDGRRIKCSRKILTERWAWFAEQQAALARKAADAVQDMPTLDINDALLGSLSPARMTPNRLHLPEPLPVCVALVQYFYTLSLATPLQNRGPVLSAMLFLSKQYKIERLGKLVVHALHQRLDLNTCIGIYEVATLAGERNLQARALHLVHQAKSGSSTRNHNRRPGSIMSNDGSQRSHHMSPPNAHGSLPETQGTTQFPGAGGSGGPVDTPVIVEPPPMEALKRRPRPESFTVPRDVVEARSEDVEETVSDRALDQLLDALDITQVPHVRTRGSRSTSRSNSPGSPSRLGTGSGRLNRFPPMLPPPDRPLPIRPADALLTPRTPGTPLTGGTVRASSPTSSEATSHFPQTPAESTRDVLSREQSPIHSLDNRSSMCHTPSKTILASLPEDDVPALDSSSQHSRHSTDESSDHSVRSLEAPTLIESQPNTAPLDGGLGAQQEQAMKALNHTASKLTRAVSLSSLSGKPRVRPSSFRESGIGHIVDIHEDRRWQAKKRISVASSVASTSTLSETEQRDRLVKFQALLAEQQRAIGISQAEAVERAKRATGGRAHVAPQGKSKLGRLGAKFANAILHD